MSMIATAHVHKSLPLSTRKYNEVEPSLVVTSNAKFSIPSVANLWSGGRCLDADATSLHFLDSTAEPVRIRIIVDQAFNIVKIDSLDLVSFPTAQANITVSIRRWILHSAVKLRRTSLVSLMFSNPVTTSLFSRHLSIESEPQRSLMLRILDSCTARAQRFDFVHYTSDGESKVWQCIIPSGWYCHAQFGFSCTPPQAASVFQSPPAALA